MMAVILVNIRQMLFATDVTDDVNFRCDPVILGRRFRMYVEFLRDRAWDPIQMRHTRSPEL